jgi:hypothetical protein
VWEVLDEVAGKFVHRHHIDTALPKQVGPIALARADLDDLLHRLGSINMEARKEQQQPGVRPMW